jgi:hypothetical protein
VKIWNAALLCGALALGACAMTLAPQPARAQGTQFPDVPANHWAYQAVTDLANKGYVIGYPDGNFLGGRTLTRYEFATVIDRIAQTVSDLSTKVGQANLTTPNGTPVTQDDLNKIQVLVDQFQTELTAIQANDANLQTELDSLRQDVLDTKAATRTALTAAEAAKAEADNSYGSGPGRKFTISGYIQARAVTTGTNDHYAFPQGANQAGAIGIGPAVNGTYAEGGTSTSEEVRRARIIVAGSPTLNTSFRLQFDMQGAVTTASSANQQVTVREANGTYTFGDGTSKYPALTAGLFATPFGYILPASQSTNLTPERPLAFNESNHVGLFDSQDYDKGAKVQYSMDNFTGTYALISGSGRQAETIDNHGDSVVRLQYNSPTKIFSVGASYYDGAVYRQRPASLQTYATEGETYPEPKKQLAGFDAQANYDGFFADYEFVRGTYESRSYFDSAAVTSSSFVYDNPLGFETDSYVKGNQVQGSYVWGGYTFFRQSVRPLTLAMDYDVFQRSITSDTSAANALQGGNPGGTYFAGGSSFDDVNLGYGALYNLDKATRVRLWYDSPFEVAHAPGTPEPPKDGLYTAELQFKF